MNNHTEGIKGRKEKKTVKNPIILELRDIEREPKDMDREPNERVRERKIRS